ncbi:TPA: Holliday junction resolvase [Candidatus Woesearchaeota archaeon]|nr:Holliday junction resolvase [Candidatus Woesearchaeota archaeon]
MNTKAKGSNAERELIHLLWSKGWAAVRIAGSGSSSYPCPDILAGSSAVGRRLAIECKSSSEMSRHLPEGQVASLVEFAGRFGAEPWIGARFNDMKWAFFSPDELKKTGAGFSVSVKMVRGKGLAFEQLLGLF